MPSKYPPTARPSHKPEGVVKTAQMVVVGEGPPQRLDNFLFRQWRTVPKSHIYQVLRKRKILVNGIAGEAALRVQSGDQIQLPPMVHKERLKAIAAPRSSPDINVLYEDDALLAIDKPSQVAAHGGSGVSFGAIEHLRHLRPHATLELVHRLDRGTSGVMLLAKKRAALVLLHEALREGQMTKVYLALVLGRYPAVRRLINLPLEKYLNGQGERRVRVSADGRASVSHTRLLARWENFSLLEITLETGRTHQIRVHLAHTGYPLCGDDKYGDFAANKAMAAQGLNRLFLHAYTLRVQHPLAQIPLTLTAPFPEVLRNFVKRIDTCETLDFSQPEVHALLDGAHSVKPAR